MQPERLKRAMEAIILAVLIGVALCGAFAAGATCGINWGKRAAAERAALVPADGPELAEDGSVPPLVLQVQSGPVRRLMDREDPVATAAELASRRGEAVAVTQNGRLVCLANPRNNH